jgi:four helix bundle protein
MARSHTELICWQLADQLRGLIIEHTADGTAAARDWRFTSNFRDAAASACRNQSEGFYKYRHSEMRPYFNSARGSLGEILDCIRDGSKRGFFTTAESEEMSNLCGRAMIANLRFLRTLQRKDPPIG